MSITDTPKPAVHSLFRPHPGSAETAQDPISQEGPASPRLVGTPHPSCQRPVSDALRPGRPDSGAPGMSGRRDGLVAGGRRLAVASTERTTVRVSDWAVSVTGFHLFAGAGIVLLHGRRSGSARNRGAGVGGRHALDARPDHRLRLVAVVGGACPGPLRWAAARTSPASRRPVARRSCSNERCQRLQNVRSNVIGEPNVRHDRRPGTYRTRRAATIMRERAPHGPSQRPF